MGSPNCLTISLTRNSIYSLHLTFYSIDLAFLLIFFFLNLYLLFWIVWLLPLLLLYLFYLIILFFLFFILLFNSWINDILLEAFIALSLTEQISLINGIKWLIFSEFMLFYSCFWSLIHFRLISPGFSLLISYPLLSNYSFSIPFSNLLILIFSSIPIQAAQIFLKIGFFILTMEGLGQSISCGLLFLILQCKEFLYSYFSLSDSMIGSIFYFTTGLHGIHVLFGSFIWFLIIYLTSSLSSLTGSRKPFLNSIFLNSLLFNAAPNNNPLFFTEQSLNFFSASYYWHFVDWVWFFVFLLFLIFIERYSIIMLLFISYSYLYFYIWFICSPIEYLIYTLKFFYLYLHWFISVFESHDPSFERGFNASNNILNSFIFYSSFYFIFLQYYILFLSSFFSNFFCTSFNDLSNYLNLLYLIISLIIFSLIIFLAWIGFR